MTINGFNANLASITNDALVAPLAAAAMVATVRFVRMPTHGRAAWVGVLVGLAFLNKTTSLGLLPLVGLALLCPLATRRAPARNVIVSALIAGAAAALVVSPWVLWNLAVYGSPTAATATGDITGSVMSTDILGLRALWAHLDIDLDLFWDFQLRHQRDGTYATVFGLASVAAFVAGGTAAMRRRDRGAAAGLAWTAAALPLAFVGMEVIVFGVFGGTGQAVGRHLYMALVPMTMVVAGGLIVALGDRWGPVAVAAVLALALVVEQRQVRFYSTYAYTSGLMEPDLAPVVDQSLSEGIVTTAGFRVDPPCAVQALALAVAEPPPPTFSIVGAGFAAQARHVGSRTTDFDSVFNLSQAKLEAYVLDRPLRLPFEVRPPQPVTLGAAGHDVESRVALLDGPGDPVALLYCAVPDPATARFEQLYRPLHPSQVTYGFLQGWPRAWAALGLAGFLVILAGAVRRRPREPYRRNH